MNANVVNGCFMTDVIYINVGEGINRVMNNTKLYCNLLKKFKNNESLKEIDDALADENMEIAQNSAHTLKGLAANLSLTELRKQTSELELQLKAGDLKADQLAILKDVYNKTIIEIDRVLDQYV